MWEIFINNLAIFTNDVRVERVNGCWSDTRVPSRSFVSVPIGCGGCWLLSRAGLMSWVVGRTFVGNLVIGLFIGYSLLGVAEVASKFDAQYHSAGFGQLVFHHFVHDV